MGKGESVCRKRTPSQSLSSSCQGSLHPSEVFLPGQKQTFTWLSDDYRPLCKTSHMSLWLTVDQLYLEGRYTREKHTLSYISKDRFDRTCRWRCPQWKDVSGEFYSCTTLLQCQVPQGPEHLAGSYPLHQASNNGFLLQILGMSLPRDPLLLWLLSPIFLFLDA